MKKLLALMLAAALTLSLVACGGVIMSMEEMLENAVEMDSHYLQDIVDGAKANKEKLLNDYKGEIVSVTSVVVSDITSGGIVTLGLSTVKTYFELKEDEVAQFEVGDLISVVGIISDITIYSDEIRIELDPVYLVEVLGPSLFKEMF